MKIIPSRLIWLRSSVVSVLISVKTDSAAKFLAVACFRINFFYVGQGTCGLPRSLLVVTPDLHEILGSFPCISLNNQTKFNLY